MSDIVVTVPKRFRYAGQTGLAAWIAEGDAAGEPWSGQHWYFTVYGPRPPINPGERVYIVCEDRLRGYAPLVRLSGPPSGGHGAWDLIRTGGAVAVTIPERITGFRGWRRRWWSLEDEVPFPDWRVGGGSK